jgi:hypothetical protein
MRWANEEMYDSAIEGAARQHDVPADLIRAVIATESNYRPEVSRVEKLLNDASIGLMQILFNTAKGEGYAGTVQGLYDPTTNIAYGASYLSSMYHRAGGDVQRAMSAYNGGWRPELGFGTKATRPVTICLARDAAGKCTKTRNVQIGEFGNQPYVDATTANLQYFQSKRSTGSVASPLIPADQQHTESQIDRHVGGTPNWTAVSAIWQMITRWIQSWFK